MNLVSDTTYNISLKFISEYRCDIPVLVGSDIHLGWSVPDKNFDFTTDHTLLDILKSETSQSRGGCRNVPASMCRPMFRIRFTNGFQYYM